MKRRTKLRCSLRSETAFSNIVFAVLGCALRGTADLLLAFFDYQHAWRGVEDRAGKHEGAVAASIPARGA